MLPPKIIKNKSIAPTPQKGTRRVLKKLGSIKFGNHHSKALSRKCIHRWNQGWPDWAKICPNRWFITLASLLKITEIIFLGYLLFPRLGLGNIFDKKMGWAIFWATFSETHPVTLVGVQNSSFSTSTLFTVPSRVARFFLVHDTKKMYRRNSKMNQMNSHVPNGHKISHMSVKYSEWP
jgi:hypothetical protein